MGVVMVLGTVRMVVAGRLMGPAELGVAGAALLILATIEGLTETALDTALVNHPGRPEPDLDAAFTLLLARGIAVGTLLFLLAPVATDFFGTTRIAPMIQVLAVVPVLRGAVNPARSLLVRGIEFERLFWWSLPEALVAFTVALAMAVSGFGAWALVVAAVLAQVVATCVSYAMAPRIPRLRWEGHGFRRLLHYGRWTFGTRFLTFLCLQLDNLLVGRFLGLSTLGQYQMAYRIGEIPAVGVSRPLAQVALPVLSQHRRDFESFRTRKSDFMRLALGVSVAFVVVLVVFGEMLVSGLLGSAWAPIVPLVWILSVATIARSAIIVDTEALYALGRPRLAFRVHAVRTLVLAVFIYPLMEGFGAVGVALAVLTSSAAAAIAARGFLRSELAGASVKRGSGAAEPEPAPFG